MDQDQDQGFAFDADDMSDVPTDSRAYVERMVEGGVPCQWCWDVLGVENVATTVLAVDGSFSARCTQHSDTIRDPQAVVVPLDRILVTKANPRRKFDDDEQKALVENIRTFGILQSLVVRVCPENEGYVLVAGERRLRAAHELGFATVPVTVHDLDVDTALEASLVENVQRVDLNPIELAEGYLDLMDRRGWRQGELAKRLGVHRILVTETVALAKLHPTIKKDPGQWSRSALLVLARADQDIQLLVWAQLRNVPNPPVRQVRIVLNKVQGREDMSWSGSEKDTPLPESRREQRFRAGARDRAERPVDRRRMVQSTVPSRVEFVLGPEVAEYLETVLAHGERTRLMLPSTKQEQWEFEVAAHQLALFVKEHAEGPPVHKMEGVEFLHVSMDTKP